MSGFFLANGQDLDAVFVSGTAPGATTGFFTVDGLDLRSRYAARAGPPLTLFIPFYLPPSQGYSSIETLFQPIVT